MQATRRPNRWLFATLLLALGGGVRAQDYVPGEILVKYRDAGQIATAHVAIKAQLVDESRRHRWQRLRLPAEVTVDEALAQYRRRPEVEYAEPNYIARKAETSPNDTYYFERQWNLQNLNAPSAWDHTQGCDGVACEPITVAVVDTGIFYNHPDLAANMWVNPGEMDDCLDPADTACVPVDDDGNGIVDDIHGVNYNGLIFNGNPLDNDTADWHGTHVAGIAGAVGNNGVGVAGVNWHLRLMAVKVLHGPAGEGTVADIIKGIDYAIAKGARVINMSLSIASYSQGLEDAITRADAAGILTVSAAGNSGTSTDTRPYYPAAIRTPNNIAVAALTPEDALASYSNYGRVTVDLGAPGGASSYTTTGVYSTVGTLGSDYDNYNYVAGTSMAAPHVTGLAALVLAHNPALSHHQVKARLLNGTDPIAALAGKTITGGKANALLAVDGTERPAVFRVSPYQAYAGDEVVITGANFGLASGEVAVGTLAFPILEWSDTSIRATIPGTLTEGSLRVNTDGSGFFVRRLNRLPTVTLALDPAAGTAPLDVTLTATGSDADGTVVRHEWDLGGGTFTEDTGTTATLSHRFAAGGSYTLRVRVTDDGGGTAIASTTLNVASADGSGGDSRCFIATAAYGSPLEGEVMALRRFRDRYLLNSRAGSALVDLYYAVSPPLADAIRDSDGLRRAVRALLRPLVAVAGWLVSDAEAGSSRPVSLEGNGPAPAVPGEFLVGFVPGTPEEEARRIVTDAGGQLREYHAGADYGLALFAGRTEEEVRTRLEGHPAVRYVEPNLIGGKTK